jgi:hypothetical protein
MKELFSEAGIKVTDENKKELDKHIHNIVDVDYKNCSETWNAIKERIEDREEEFLRDLKTFR